MLNAERLWERQLSPKDRERLGGDFGWAYGQFGTAGMWAKLRGVTPYRAVVEVANLLNLLTDSDRDWLLRETGENTDADDATLGAIVNGDLVVVEHPRAAHWNGDEIEIDWYRHGALWDFFWELVRHAKAGQPVDSTVFRHKGNHNVVADRKSRLCKFEEFPTDLADQIKSVCRGTQQLMMPRERIRVFEHDGFETLREWLP